LVGLVVGLVGWVWSGNKQKTKKKKMSNTIRHHAPLDDALGRDPPVEVLVGAGAELVTAHGHRGRKALVICDVSGKVGVSETRL
jgi:hypothetical protein